MADVCINCGRSVPINSDDEFCQTCLNEMDKMIDRKTMLEYDEVETEQNFNPFFEAPGRLTGRVTSKNEGSIESHITDEGGASFINGLIVITVLSLFMVVYYIYL